MPTVTLNKDVFEKLVGKRLPLERLKDRISMLGTDLERIGGNEIVVEVFPNRPDMLSEQGFARAFAAFIGAKEGLKQYLVEKPKKDYRVTVTKEVARIRPYTACAIVVGLSFDDERIKEVIQIQEKLHVTFGRNRKKAAIGIYPLEGIALPITYTAKAPDSFRFRPLEYPSELSGRQILSKHPKGRDYARLLEGAERYPLFIDARGSILSMPPIINSHLTGKISERTREVFIECSGHDLPTLQQCLNMIVCALADMGGEIHAMRVAYPDRTVVTPDLAPRAMALDCGYINRRLGLSLSEKEMVALLARMGHGHEKGRVLIPAYRADILHQVDLAEDVAIAYGYENFEPEIPNVSTIGAEDPSAVFRRKVGEILVGLGLMETSTYNITDKASQTARMRADIPLVPLKNALTADYDTLRAWVLPSVLGVLESNRQYEYPQNLFCIGEVFSSAPAGSKAETGVREQTRVAVALCGRDADYTAVRQVFQALFDALATGYTIRPAEHPSFIEGRVGRVSVGDGKGQRDVAYIGELHPEAITNFGLEMPVAGFELNLSELFSVISGAEDPEN
ncbi:phenylalanine--tRNA ligase subunit beta [Candidatus Woesearchaeota archaeon]|nr:phenylalanine--tRNA ligase subunit beta [Candidatus Woesearchaeota archaeon]